MFARNLSVFTLFAYASAIAFPHVKQQHGFDWDQTKYLLAFGDSYTYVQGTHGLQNYSFIGDFLDLAYSPVELLSDRVVQNQTATAEGGPNWVEHLTGCAVKDGLYNPQDCPRQLWDFAFAGADISEEYTPLHHNFSVPLVNQTAQFATYGQPVLSPRIVQRSRTLVAIWIGINDIGDSAKYNASSYYPVTSFYDFYNTIVGTLFADSVSLLYELGYRDFLFMNLPPLDRTPGNVGVAHPSPNKTQIDLYDAALSNHSAAFAETHAGANTMLFDVNTFLNGVLDDPDRYGIINTTDYCESYDQPFINTDPGMYGCLPLPQYFWFNTGHLTSHVHAILAVEVEKFLNSQQRR